MQRIDLKNMCFLCALLVHAAASDTPEMSALETESAPLPPVWPASSAMPTFPTYPMMPAAPAWPMYARPVPAMMAANPHWPLVPLHAQSVTTTPGAEDTQNLLKNYIYLMMMSPGAFQMPMPLVPTTPMLNGLAGMSARRVYNPFGPHWDAQVQTRATAAAETLVEPTGLFPQNKDHPNYPPGFPFRFGFSTMYPGMQHSMGGMGNGFL